MIVFSSNSKGDCSQSFEGKYFLALLGIDLPNRDVTNGTQAYPMEGTDLRTYQMKKVTNGAQTYQIKIVTINERNTDIPNENSNERTTVLPNEDGTVLNPRNLTTSVRGWLQPENFTPVSILLFAHVLVLSVKCFKKGWRLRFFILTLKARRKDGFLRYLVKTLSGGKVDCSEDWHPSN